VQTLAEAEPDFQVSPLTRHEERLAVEAALDAVRSERLRVYGAELRVEKNPEGGMSRQVFVLVADLDGYTPFEVIVDPEAVRIVEVLERPELVPPFSVDEIREAIVLARSDGTVRELADRWGVEAATFYPTSRENGSEGSGRRRRLGLHLLDTNDPSVTVPVASVVVDLTAAKVESVELHGPLPAISADPEVS
jgi:transposase-like protein